MEDFTGNIGPSMILFESLKHRACQAIDDAADSLHELSTEIWKHPELGYKERFAHDILAKFLTEKGFQVERSFKLDTAFRATYCNSPVVKSPNIAFISEYDALPNIGHACGHNLIAEIGVAAGIGLMAAMSAYGKPCGQVTVIGTPAEEGYGGKVDMIKAGAFDGIDAVMMAHPFPDNDPVPIMLAREKVTYHGKSSHAAGFPWEGINALDAAVMCYNNIACLRQQVKPTHRIHCIMREGGVRINIIPEKAVLELCVRAPTDREMRHLKQKVLNCAIAAATATGCKVEHETMDKIYSSVLHNKTMVSLYESNLEPMLTATIPRARAQICGSTDMGNVTHVIPGIHPHFYIGGTEVNHTKGFTADAGDARAQKFTLDQAKALAMTGLDLMFNADILQKAKTEFQTEVQLDT